MNVTTEAVFAVLQRRAEQDRLVAEMLTSAAWEAAYLDAAAVLESRTDTQESFDLEDGDGVE